MIDVKDTGRLEIVQRYPHPVETVFKAWTSASKVKPWWGPEAFTATMFECNFREGGAWRATIVGPDGKSYDQSGRYTQIEANKAIAFTFKWGGADSPETDVTVDFATDGDGTLITFRQAPFSSEEGRRGHELGWAECLVRLDNHLKEIAK